MKKILTLDELYSFCVKNNYTKFSSEDRGYQISVRIPAFFTVEKQESNEDCDDTLMYGVVKMFHIGKNLNHSFVTYEAAKKAMKTIPYKPLLAAFCEYTNESGNLIKDFTEHEAIVNEDGTIDYIEQQVGCFTCDDPWIEYDDELGVDFVYAKCAIPKYYTSTCEILKRKNGTKVSVEFAINDMSYSKKDECLYLNDVIVQGETLLGMNPETKTEYKAGMKGSRLDLLGDSSMDNNSHFDRKEEERTMAKYKEMFDAKDKQDEEETQSKEDTATSKDNNEVEDGVSTSENPTDTEDTQDIEEDTTDKKKDKKTVETEVEKDDKDCKKYVKTFQLSFDDIRGALYRLLEATEKEKEDYFYIVDVFDDYFIYQSVGDNCIMGQKYSKDKEDNVFFVGEPYDLYREYLTIDEKKELDNIRESYQSISAELKKYKDKEDYEDKMEVFKDESYKGMLDSSEFKLLMSEDSIKRHSKKELKDKADIAFAKIVKTRKTFKLEDNSKEKETKNSMFAFGRRDEHSSFLDGLLNKRD